MIPLVVFGHRLAGVPGDLLPVLSGFLIQVQRQRPHFVEARHFLFLPALVTACHLPRLFEGPRQISLLDLRPMILGLRLLLFFAVWPAMNQVGRDDVIPAPADNRLQFFGHFEPDPGHVAGLGRLLLDHIQKPFPDPIEPHVKDVGAALRRDECQVDCVLQPARCLLTDRLQALDGVPLALLLLDPVDGASRRVVRAQALRRSVVEDVDQQSAALVGRARGEGVQHFRDHADRDLVDGLALEVFPEAPEVDGVQAQGPLRQLARRKDVALVGVEEAGEGLRRVAQH